MNNKFVQRRVFVSYSRADTEIVLPLVEQLEKESGVQFWIDREGIESAAQFEEVIIKAIDEAEVVLFMLSDNSQHSQWTKDEISYAKNTGKRVVPIVLDGGELKGWFLFKFGRINYIDATKKDQLQRLVRDLRQWLHIDRKQSHTDKVHEESEKRYEGEERIKPKPEKKSEPKPTNPHVEEDGEKATNDGIAGKITVIVGVSVLALLIGWWLYDRYIDALPISSPTETIEDHGYVDLGLSVKWATQNVGADSPGDYGDYYPWGATITEFMSVHPDVDSLVGKKEGFKMITVIDSAYIKTYDNSTYNYDIGGDPSLDAARAKWGGTWRLPTADEFQELIDNCRWTWTTYGDHKGYKVRSKKNGNSIFLPAAGYNNEYPYHKSEYAEQNGYYWSSSPCGSDAQEAIHLYFNSRNRSIRVDEGIRYYGSSVRPVSE